MLTCWRQFDQLLVALTLALASFFAAAPAQSESGNVVVVGTLTDEGAECPAMRADDGTLYTLTPRNALGLTQIGARVRIEGTVAEISICQQGTTIEVTRIEAVQ